MVALRMGGAQQRGEFASRRGLLHAQGVATRIELRQRGLLAREFGVGRVQRAAGIGDALVHRAQFAAGSAALAFQPAAFGRHVLQFALDRLQPTLRLAIVRLLCRRRACQRPQQRDRDEQAQNCHHPASNNAASNKE